MPIKKIQIWDQFHCVGKVLRPQGVKGELKIQNFSDIPGRYKSLEYIYIGPSARLSAPYKVDEVKETRGYVFLRLESGNSINDVEQLGGLYCFVPENILPDLPDDQFYVKDLVGLKVYDTEEKQVGVVDDVLQNPANDVLVVKRDGQEYFIPMVEEFIISIDLENQRINIKLIEGLEQSRHAH